ncbi:variant erythrocyte surface antigen-1 family protein, partial [Babesia divergens]
MVVYMCYTDVFVGQTDNINNLKNALNAELGSFNNNSNDLTQLVHGLCLFMGYPSCLCKPKKSVEESLERISKELKEELKNYECLSISISNSDLNCNSSCKSDEILCKCCVLDCISKVQNSTCQCVKAGSKNCNCSDVEPKRCCKDLLEKLKASLSLLNLKADMAEICKCTDENCCVKGVCTKGSSKCQHCDKLKTPKDYTVTGLGLLRPSPKRLAERLDKFFGDSGRKGSCTCKCNGSTPDKSCCCLACPDNHTSKQNCLKSCDAQCGTSGCSCAQPQTSQCPCKTFCEAINGIKIAAESTERTCCKGGTECHCGLDPQKCTASSSSGQKCCIEKDSKGNYKHSVKCMIRRLVLYFKDLKSDISSPSIKNFKNCCEFLCVLKTCEFLDGYLKDEKGKAKDFYNALQELRFAGPCGQELWRTLDDFIYFIRYVFYPKAKGIQTTLQDKSNGHAKKCKCTPGSCTCSSNSSCPGCAQVLEKLKDHKDVLSLMTRGYVSSYTYRFESVIDPPAKSTYASWNSLSQGEQKKAAKIFLGMLPCLYFGLKILHDRSKYGSGFAGWHDISIANDKPSSDLAKFLQAWGYDVRPLISKKGFEFSCMLENLFSSGSLNSLYEKSQNYFTSRFTSLVPSSSSGSQDPSTVRQMLLWLYGLRFQKHFSDLVEICKSLCLPFGNSFHPDDFCYYIHTCSFILPVSIISFIETSDSALSLISSSSEFSKFLYPSDSSALADMFFDYIRKVYIALDFLKFQCNLAGSQAGWQYCYFGQKCSEKFKGNSLSSTSGSSSSSSGCTSCKYSGAYLCTGKPYGTDDAHDHCAQTGQTCVGFGSNVSKGCSGSNHQSGSDPCSNPCPHPLQRFLIDDFSESKSQDYPFGLSDITPMGFSPDKLSSTARWGQDLYHVLKAFCQDGFYPLTRLVQFALCIFRNPPETLGELFAFFMKFKDSPVFSKNFVEWINGEPGFYSGEDLQDALEKLYGSHSGNSHSDLQSLFCSSGSTCGKYLYSLTENAYNNNIFIDDFLDTYLSWVCYSAEKFKEKLEKFQGKFSSCCSSGSCQKIVECPCALPFLYKNGFTFWSPNSLNDNNKKCSDFIAQLKAFVGNSTLDDLIEEIERFIWSIRLPFFF